MILLDTSLGLFPHFFFLYPIEIDAQYKYLANARQNQRPILGSKNISKMIFVLLMEM